MRRLIGFIVLFTIFLIFIVINLENKADISFGFFTAKEVPVYLSVFLSFIAGMVIALIIAYFRKSKPKSSSSSNFNKPLVRRDIKSTESGYYRPDETEGKDGPYGID